ncbi:MAG: hypothetical protein KDI48_09415 [Xanthomonadales bacterium]|nr:hypothetical protein [Xanthomonadales bacterium]
MSATDAASTEFDRRRRCLQRWQPPLLIALSGSALLLDMVDGPLAWVGAAGMMLSSLTLVALHVWTWRCPACGAGIRLDGRQCSSCGRDFGPMSRASDSARH